MADKPIKPPGSITESADAKNERIAEVSNVNSAISRMQQRVNQQLSETEVDVGSYEGIEEVQNSMVKVLHSLNDTVGSIGYGFAKIAAETTKASAGAIKQYGKAVSEDMRLNRQNVVAMALARSSPIFGYFAAKFVETDVFQNAKEKMKTNISEALGGVTSKFKEGISGLIGRAKQKGEKEKPIKPIKASEKIPKMQHGGYVERAGMAYLHPAEVVIPIERLLSTIDESISVTKDLAKVTKAAQLSTLAKVSTYVASVEKLEKVGMFKGFLRAMRQVHEQYTEPSDVRMLRALLAIQQSLGATVGTWPQIWQKMLVEHPTFRQIAFAMRGLSATFSLPFQFVYSVFKSRGGYQAHLSRSKNPLKAMVENIGLVYTEGMWRLDNIALFTRATAEAVRDISSAITGKSYAPIEGVPRGIWSIFGLARGLTNWATKNLSKLVFGALGTSIKLLAKQPELGELFTRFGRQLGDVLTKEYKLLPRMLHRGVREKDVYGPGTKYFGLINEKVEQEVKRIHAIPVSEIHMERFAERADEYMIHNVKEQKKLITYTSDIADTNKFNLNLSKKVQKKLLGYTSDILDINKSEYKVTKRMDDREKRRSIFGFFGGAFGAVKNLIGAGLGFITPMLSGFLVPALTGVWTRLFPKGIVSTITGTLLPVITGLVTKIFPKGIAASITTLLSSPIVWTSIAGAAAFAFGAAIGKLLDKLFGISVGFKKYLDKIDKKVTEASNVQSKMLGERYKRARGGGMGGYEALEELKIKSQFGAFSKEREASIGVFGRQNLLEIDVAQQKYMGEHLGEYLKYGQEQVKALRQKWITEEGFPAKPIGYNATKYGAKREADFLKYLKREGKPLTEIEKTAGYETYAYKYYDKYNIKDRAGGVIMDVKSLAREGAEQAVAQTKAITEQLKEQGKEFKEGAEKIGKGISTSVNQATNAVTTSVQNFQHVVNNSTQKVRSMFSEYDHAVIKGDLVDDFYF